LVPCEPLVDLLEPFICACHHEYCLLGC
jgi:hypothetical protein